MRRWRWLFPVVAMVIAFAAGWLLLFAVPVWREYHTRQRHRSLMQGDWTAPGVAVTIRGEELSLRRPPAGSGTMFWFRLVGPRSRPGLRAIDVSRPTVPWSGDYKVDQDRLWIRIGPDQNYGQHVTLILDLCRVRP